ncbi:MAG: hypothetical protein DBW76_01570 [Bacteroidetes bacterium]|jgi:hypothetical protein|nr:hypothetical protein [Flavobacteriaceae bacterium]RCL69336.1 MAG: hypothetical protein DBW76_01570 [Bacteroidota bacterium]|tara:strand:+ start:67 stop:717 length:651 start_codon:yes stop_codon:yes gene_type:complete
MKSYTLLFLFLFLSVNLFSQETSIKSLKIKSLDTNNVVKESFNLNRITPKGLTNKPSKNFFNYNLDFDIKSKNNEIDITYKTDLVSPTWKIRQTFNEGSGNKSKFSKDFYLGDLETKSKYIVIKCRDHEYVDGDRIRLLLNGAVIHPNISLTSVYYIVDVDLDEGYNNIDFIALNEGESSPNTAQLIVLDEFGNQLSNKKWLISTGYKAKLVVFKK